MSRVRKSHSRMLAACARRNSAQLCSSRLGAGSIPSAFRITQTVLAASVIPSPTSSPGSAGTPQLGFSRASRSTSTRISVGVGRRPGRRRGYVQRRATNSRCQRRSVPGVTNSDRFHACRGSTRLNAASNTRSAGVSAGSGDLPLKHAQLMAQEQDLDLLLPLRAEPQHDKLKQTPQ